MFCPVLIELLEQGCTVGKSGKVFNSLAALSTRSNLETIHRLMLHLAPTRTLEVGFAFGGSALVICAAHQELGHAPEHQHVVIDPYQTSIWDSCGLVGLDRASLSDFVDLHLVQSPLGQRLPVHAIIRTRRPATVRAVEVGQPINGPADGSSPVG